MLGLRAESPEPIELKSLQLGDATFWGVGWALNSLSTLLLMVG